MEICKIFQIGFNKCGTTSIYSLFKDYCNIKFKCVHWDQGKLAATIKFNIDNSLPPLLRYEDHVLFSDMEYASKSNCIMIYQYFYKILDESYPQSKFILNTRNLSNWIKSRLNHNKGSLKRVHSEYYKVKDEEELISIWKKQWFDHHADVLEHFKNRPDDLLIFDIENDNFEKFSNFFIKYNIKFNVKKCLV